MGINLKQLKVVGSTVVACAAVLTMTACGPDGSTTAASPASPAADQSWGAVEERGKSQGAVQIYTTLVPAQYDSVAAAFKKQYPEIALSFTRGTTAELAARADAEIASNSDGADIVLLAGSQWHSPKLANLTDLASLPAAESWPEEAWAEKGKVPKISYSPQAMITWNTNVFPEGFSDWSDVPTPAASGKLGIYENPDLNTATYYTWLESTNGPDYIPQLAELEPRFYPSVVPMSQALASGEIGVSLFNVTAIVKDLQSKGAPIDYVIPEQTEASFFVASVLEKSKRQDAAKLLLNFIMTPEGQESLNGQGFASSPLPGVPGTLQPKDMHVLGMDPVLTQPDVDAWNKKFKEIFNR